MHHPKLNRKLISLAVAGACLSAATAFAQDAGNNSPADTSVPTDTVQTVVVSGLRASLATSLNLKRQSDGIVDGIVAEDIGKFPDTNLAESLQRISGVSISRSNGEGSQVTVRGIDPGLNMVLLNGRQMPTASGGSRAFDFGNIASDAISQLQVYKTSRAETPVGGIGATINIMTARPLDRKGFYGSVGVKGVYDSSNNNVPTDDRTGKALTPEFSALVSTTTADGHWGFGASASYQKRDSGRAVASTSWTGPYKAGTGNDRSGDAPSTGLYTIPQNWNYNFTGTSRARTNAQLVLQFAPIKEVTTTLDYTYSGNKYHTLVNDASAWFNKNAGTSTYTNHGGGIESPLMYSEKNTDADWAMGSQDFALKNQNKSVGFNAQWKVNNDLKFEFDIHHSTAESLPDSPNGSGGVLASASFSRGLTTIDLTHEFPILSVQGIDFARAPQEAQGSVFSTYFNRGVVDQVQVKGRLRVLESSTLLFGIGATKVQNRAANGNVQNNFWGQGAAGIAREKYPTDIWHPINLSDYFSKFGGSDSAALVQGARTFKMNDLLAFMRANAPDKSIYGPTNDYNQGDSRTTEKSKDLYGQVNTDWDTAMPMHTALGLRYEKTDITSSARATSGEAIVWGSENELPITFGPAVFTTLTGKYHYLLPSLDWDMDVTSKLKVRASYGETIGRPSFDKLLGGQNLGSIVRTDFGNANQGNPGLKPVKSKNLDLSAEYYYGKSSFIAINGFWKHLSDFAAQSEIRSPLYNLHTPAGGALWNEAINSAQCKAADIKNKCIREYIFANHPTAPGVDVAKQTITGQPGDPLAIFKIQTFANSANDKLNGAEFNLQHMFGDTGFGVTANYTYVHSGLHYNNASTDTQAPLIGLSNSANLVGIFENDKVTVRLAYNWRGEYLDGAGGNPSYTDPYGQLDLSVGYALAKNLNVTFEAFNFTNQTYRQHARTYEALSALTQTGPRYTLGLRYKF
jgi:TonB-dependent receptor